MCAANSCDVRGRQTIFSLSQSAFSIVMIACLQCRTTMGILHQFLPPVSIIEIAENPLSRFLSKFTGNIFMYYKNCQKAFMLQQSENIMLETIQARVIV